MLNTGIMVKLYALNELSENARQKAIEEHRQFELSIMSPNDFISGCPEYDTEEELQKAYEADKKSRKKREAYQYTFAQVEAIDNLCDMMDIYFDDEEDI